MNTRSSLFGNRLSANRVQAPRAARLVAVRVMDMNCLVVNTKGGGHAFIGLYLAKELMAKGHTVTIMNAGDQAKVGSKNPFKQYSTLEAKGAKVMWADPTDPATFPAESFDVVYDNNGKTIDECKALIDKYGKAVKHYVFVSSAGMHKANKIEPAIFEDDARNEKDHFFVEEYLKEHKVPFTIFRPLYIYGPYTGKDYEQWFMDRILRDRAVCIPKPGTQLTSLSHVEDVASMMAAVPGNAKAIGQAFSCANDRAITLKGICNEIGKAAGKEPKIVLYSPDKVDLKKGEGFPLRAVHFFPDVTKAKQLLGWKPKHTFVGDVKQRLDEYIGNGRMDKEVDFSVDDKILASLD